MWVLLCVGEVCGKSMQGLTDRERQTGIDRQGDRQTETDRQGDSQGKTDRDGPAQNEREGPHCGF